MKSVQKRISQLQVYLLSKRAERGDQSVEGGQKAFCLTHSLGGWARDGN